MGGRVPVSPGRGRQRHVGGDRYGKQYKKSVYVGKEEVWRGIG
jgi:hypothetical protein